MSAKPAEKRPAPLDALLEQVRADLEKGWIETDADSDRAAREAFERQNRATLLDPVRSQVPMHCRGPRVELIRRIAPALFIVAENWDWSSPNLVLLGQSGAGKTTAAAYLIRKLCADGVRQGGEPFDLARLIRWQECRELSALVRESRLGTGTPEAITRCQNARLLVLDDLGAHDDRSALERVLNARYERGWPTITTSGLTPDELQRDLGEAIFRRLVEMRGRKGRVVVAQAGKGAAR